MTNPALASLLSVDATTIGGTSYRVSKLTTSVAMPILLRITKAWAGGVKNLSEEKNMMSLVQGVLANLTEDDLALMQRAFMQTTTVVEGAKEQPMSADMFEIKFQGRYEDMFEWLVFCIQTNFSRFFAEAGQKLGALLRGPAKANESASKSPIMSIG